MLSNRNPFKTYIGTYLLFYTVECQQKRKCHESAKFSQLGSTGYLEYSSGGTNNFRRKHADITLMVQWPISAIR